MSEPANPRCRRCLESEDLRDYPSGGFLVCGPDDTVYQLPSDTQLCHDCHAEVVKQVRETGGVSETLEGYA